MRLTKPCLLSLVLILTIFLPAVAQQQPCTPPALPATTEPNIFTEEKEVYLGDAVAEHIQSDYKVVEDPESQHT